jgi:hypothetical protein
MGAEIPVGAEIPARRTEYPPPPPPEFPAPGAEIPPGEITTKWMQKSLEKIDRHQLSSILGSLDRKLPQEHAPFNGKQIGPNESRSRA